MVTEQQAQEWRELAEAATPGPWWITKNPEFFAVVASHPVEVGDTFIAVVDGELSKDSEHDAAFIAAARTAVPALLAERDDLAALWTQVVACAEESTNSTTYISAYNMSRVRDLVREWKETQHAVLE